MKSTRVQDFRIFILSGTLAVLVFSLLSLLGWYFDSGILRQNIFDLVPMHPLSGMALLFCVGSLWGILLKGSFLSRLSRPLALAVLGISLLRFLQVIGLTDFRLDHFLFGDSTLPARFKGVPRGMAPNTAFNFILCGISLLLLNYNRRQYITAAHLLSLISASISLLCIIGYVYGCESFYTYSVFLPMAPSTAICFFLVTACLLLVEPEKSFMSHLYARNKGGHLARILIPISVIVPVLLGLILILGENRGLFSRNYALALNCSITILIFVVSIWFVAKEVNRRERALRIEIYHRKLAEEVLKKKMEDTLLNEQVNKQRMLVRAVIEGQEKERKEIGMDLHDNINQILTSIKLMLDMAHASREYREEFIEKASRNINYCITEIRSLSKALVPPKIDDSNLIDSISDMMDGYKESKGIHIKLSFSEEVLGYISEDQGLAMFRIIQEQMNNIVRHADASSVFVGVWEREGHIHLRIKDDGRGFDPVYKKKGIGISNMENRAQMLQGQLSIRSEPEMGCVMELSFPAGD